MIFAIRLSSACQGLFENRKLTDRDLVKILKSHAKKYITNPTHVMWHSELPNKRDPLGTSGSLIWLDLDDESDFDSKEFGDWSNLYTNPFSHSSSKFAQIDVYSKPPELKDTFDFDALGLTPFIK